MWERGKERKTTEVERGKKEGKDYKKDKNIQNRFFF